MCGICFVKRKHGVNANKAIIKRYKRQKARGTEGYGFIEIHAGVVKKGFRSEGEEAILEALEKSTADEILFHHRTPTSTPNFTEATHPIVVKNKSLKYDYFVVHNGIIYNDTEMKEDHEKEGFVYTTKITKQWLTSAKIYSSSMFNDSEAMAIDFCKSLESGEPMRSRGSIALIALQSDKKTKNAVALYYGRNEGNPLKIEIQPDFFALSSESGKLLPSNTLYRFDYKTEEITEEKKSIGTTSFSGASDDAYDYRSGYGMCAPDYGHYDNTTGQWVDADGSRKSFTGKGGDIGIGLDDTDWDDDDDDYPLYDEVNGLDVDTVYEWDNIVFDLKMKIREAQKENDYDKMYELEEELSAMQDHYDELKREHEADLIKTIEKKVKASKQRKIGFDTSKK